MPRAVLPPGRTLPAVFGPLMLAAAPKCPFCLLAWAGVGGWAAALGPAYGRWLLPGTVAALVLTVAALAWRPRRGYGPAGVAAAGAVLFAAAKFWAGHPPATYAAAALLGIAVAWGSWPARRGASPAACGSCAPTPLRLGP